MKRLKVIKPGLLLTAPRTIPYRTNRPLFALFSQPMLFFQENMVWVWESELKEDLAKEL